MNPDFLNIIVCHSPNGLIDNNGNLITCKELPLLKNASLILSGHNHAALTPKFLREIMPRRRGIISPKSKILPKNMYGVFSNNEMQYLITSGGVTKLAENTGNLHRLDACFSSEIEMVDLIPSEENSLKLIKK